MPIERKLAAIMFTDIAGYTALSAKDSTKASELLKTQRDILKPIVEKHGGSWMKEIGDGLLLTFDSATSAVECSIAIQEAAKDIEDLNLRIGIHEGEVIKQDGDVIGDDVNVASRIEPFSAIGGVAISDKIYRAISSNQEFETKYIGKPKLKGVSQEVKVYCITSHGLPETDITKVSAKLEEEEVKSRFNIFALTGGILTAIGIAFWIAVGVFDVSFGGKTEVPSVGILMMENLGKEDEEFWSSGMTADLITKVAGAGLIRVAPLDDILKLDKELSIGEKARKLRVKYILTHSFLIKDDGFDLWCKLENIETGVALFSNKISEPMNMTTQMVGKLANDIITSLKVKTKQDVMKAPTNNAEAYAHYLKAKNEFYKRQDFHGVEIAQGLLQKAIELDDNLIKAKVLLSNTYREMGEKDKSMEIALNTLKQAEGIGDDIGVGYVLINIAKNHDWDDTTLYYLNRSYEKFKEIDDKQGMSTVLDYIGNYYSVIGDLDNASDYVNYSLELSEQLEDKHGIGASLVGLGWFNYIRGDYIEALPYFNRAMRIWEESEKRIYIQNVLTNFGLICFQQHEYIKALEYFDKSATMQLEVRNEMTMETVSHLFLTKKKLGKEYDEQEINIIINKQKEIHYQNLYALYYLLEDTSYLETAYNQIQEITDAMEDEFKAKFLSYPIPKAIVEEWEKVK